MPDHMPEPGKKARNEARRAVRAAVITMAQIDGSGTEPHPLWPGSTTTEPRPAVAVEGLRFALMLRDAATSQAREFARWARAEGLSWRQLGEILAPALGISGEDVDLPARAFEWSAGAEFARPFADLVVTWTCPACHERIRDHGPYDADPRNNEAGHGDGCARLAQAVAAYDAEWGEE